MNRPFLQFGSSGTSVALLQKALNLASAPSPLLVVDGLFGPKTHACVCRFQGSQKLVQDGKVGPKTHSKLEEAYKALAKLADDYIIPPADEAAARQRIVDIAKSQLWAFGWLSGAVAPDPGSPRIAIRYMTNAATRTRQGGFPLSIIYGLAGMPAVKCLTIPNTKFGRNGEVNPVVNPQEKIFGLAANDANPLGETTYKSLRNEYDLERWCGIFALSVWISAGLKNLQTWKSKPFLPANGFVKAIGPKNVKEGDIGIVEPMGGRNHYFIVTKVVGDEFHSVDGNAGDYHSIYGRKYKISNPNSTGDGPHMVTAIPGVFGSEKAYFVTPVWSEVK